jgi:hypothetical protein
MTRDGKTLVLSSDAICHLTTKAIQECNYKQIAAIYDCIENLRRVTMQQKHKKPSKKILALLTEATAYSPGLLSPTDVWVLIPADTYNEREWFAIYNAMYRAFLLLPDHMQRCGKKLCALYNRVRDGFMAIAEAATSHDNTPPA